MSEQDELQAQIERMESKSSERAADGHFWGRPGFSEGHADELHRAKARLAALRATDCIVRVPTYGFEYGGYRYTDVNGAPAEANRRAEPDQPLDMDSRWEEGGEA